MKGIIIRMLLFPFRWIRYKYRMLATRYHGRNSRLKSAIRKANRRHAKTGKRYRVFFLGMRYRVYNRDEIKNFKKAGIFNRYINSTSIDKMKFYDTNDIPPCPL